MNMSERINSIASRVAAVAENEVERLLKTVLPGSPFAGKAHAVGGYVRDQVMGLEAKDLDIVVEMKGGAKAITAWLHNLFPTQTTDPHELGAGYPIWQITFRSDVEQDGEVYKTAGAVIEFADAQKEAFPDPTTRQRVTEPGTLEDDVQRRDFTVNMLMRDLSTGELKDLTGVSQQDIQKGVLRGHPAVDFNKILRDDPLRMLRLVRFQAKYGWQVPLSVLKIVARNAERIQIVSAERIRDELVKLMKLGKLGQAVKFMKAVGLLKYVMPEINAMRGVTQSPEYHAEGDVFKHTLLVLRNAPPTVEGQLAALLHDVGKPQTREVVGDAIRFHGHEDVGAEIAKAILYRMKFDAETIKKVVTMVGNHMRPHHLPDASEKALRKFIRDLGEEMTDAVVELAQADEISSLGELSIKGEVQRLKERLKKVREAPVPVARKTVLNGNEIMQLLGVKPGPVIRQVQDFLMDYQDDAAAEGREVTKEDAMKAVMTRFGTTPPATASMRSRRASLHKGMVAGASELVADIVFEAKRKDNEDDLDALAKKVNSFLGQIRQNEGLESFVLRTDWEDQMVLTVGMTEHEQKMAILRSLDERVGKLAVSMGVQMKSRVAG